MTDYLHFLFEIFLILVQIAGGLSLVLVVVVLILLKKGYSFYGRYYKNEKAPEWLISDFDFEQETLGLWCSIPRKTHAIYDRIKTYGTKCYRAGLTDGCPPDKWDELNAKLNNEE